MSDVHETAMIDRRGLRVLDLDECLRRLERTPVGRLGFTSAGEQVILPMNHAVDGSSIVFRTMLGSKMEAAVAARTVAYEIDAFDPVAETGWSVVVKGTAEAVSDAADIDRYDALGLRSWADPDRLGRWIRVRPAEISGREIEG
jgi:uncharacterized protein